MPAPTLTAVEMSVNDAPAALERVLDQLATIVLDKPQQLRLAVACVLARGHLLIEDLPGVGKTTLARALATTLGLDYKRIQFTSDMLPADIIGVSVYRRDRDTFEFQPGPVFSELLLADEINRATPKAQSALLEAMQENQVSVDGSSLALPQPFHVIATQNPTEQIGTFALPESQLDRFLMRIELGYPSASAERALLAGHDSAKQLESLSPVLSASSVVALQQHVTQVHLSDSIIDYLQAIVNHTREQADIVAGLSPRGAIALRLAAQAMALIDGRQAVYPDDVQAVAPAVLAHRLHLLEPASGRDAVAFANSVIEAVPIP
ncbi:MAG: MoxR family ATPase [Pseudomonadota bacterium]